MSLKNTTDSYGTMAISLHWIMSILAITMLIVGFTMINMEDGADKWSLYSNHKAAGLIVLALALFRWYWILSNDKPQPLANWSKAEIAISHATQWILMIMLVIMPVAGIIRSLSGGHDISFFGIFTIEGFVDKPP